MTTTQKRATRGGEVGANGEFYEGGRFINTVPENAKKYGSVARKPRKVEVEPFVWVVDDRRPLLQFVGHGAEWIDRRDWKKGIKPSPAAFERFGDRMYNGQTLAETVAICERWNAGERWL